MKRLVSILIVLLAFSAISQAQRTGTSEFVGSINYQHLFMDDSDAIDYSGGFLLQFGESGDTHLLTIGISF